MDQDDSMVSTPSSDADIDESIITNPTHDNQIVDDDEEMFPANEHAELNSRPRTPQNDHLNAAAPGELSPPRSQTNTRDRDTEMQQEEDVDLSPTNPNLGAGGAVGAAGGIGADSQDAEWRPGYGWKNKKAELDMHKALEGFSDRDFSLKQFGDVLAHRIGVETGHQ